MRNKNAGTYTEVGLDHRTPDKRQRSWCGHTESECASNKEKWKRRGMTGEHKGLRAEIWQRGRGPRWHLAEVTIGL